MARFIIQTRTGQTRTGQTRNRAQASPGLDLQITPVGFCWPAFILGPLWLLNQGAWAIAIADAGFLALIQLLADMIRPGLWPLLVTILLAERLFIGFESFDALRAHWAAKGFVQTYPANGDDEEEAIARWLITQRPAAPSAPKSPPPRAPGASNSLFPLSGLMGKWAQSKSSPGLKS
jgi:hypothetical protein